MNDLILRTLAGENPTRAPVWIMRQAGRHLPEYRKLKESYGFWELARTPELTTKVTLQPVERYGVDAAILFSDIMTPLPAMGLELDFAPGPVLENPVRGEADVERLRVPEQGEIAPFVTEALRLLREASPVPVIGFAGAPLTLATYAVEGKGSKEYPTFRGFLRSEPELAERLLELLATVTARYLRLQVEAGAQAVQLFDSWAGLHDAESYRRFGLPYARKALAALDDLGVPRIYLALGGAHLFDQVRRLPCEAVSVDWRTPLNEARPRLWGKVLQGNLDPAALLAPPDRVAQAARSVLRAGLGGPHVFNLGHGIFPQTDPDAVARLVDTVRGFDRRKARDLLGC